MAHIITETSPSFFFERALLNPADILVGRKQPFKMRQGRQVQTTINYFDDPGVPLVPMIVGG
jgi:hypothetical protein